MEVQEDNYKRVTFNTDPDEYKKLCLNCKKAECDNCLRVMPNPTKKSKCGYNRGIIEPLIKANMSQLQIARVLNVGKKTAHDWVNRYWVEKEMSE